MRLTTSDLDRLSKSHEVPAIETVEAKVHAAVAVV